MHRVITALLFVIVSSLPLPAAPVKFASWNLEWFPGGSPKNDPVAAKAHMEKAQAALKDINPDVLCLQEVRDWKAVEELVSVLPGYRVDVVSRFDGKQQQAIASRLDIDSAWSEKWKSGGAADPPRGYSFAALKAPDGTFLLVYSLHMKANGRSGDEGNIAKREESSRQLAAHIEEMEKIYGQRGKVAIVLAGDWNTTLDSNPRFDGEQTIRSLLTKGFHSTFENVPFEQRITLPAENPYPAVSFDHILTSGLGAPAAHSVADTGASDHNPVVVTLFEPAPVAALESTPTAVEAAASPEPATP